MVKEGKSILERAINGPWESLLPMTYLEAQFVQYERGGVIVKHPSVQDKWCVFENPQKELPKYRPDIDPVPVYMWVLACFDERRLREMSGQNDSWT